MVDRALDKAGDSLDKLLKPVSRVVNTIGVSTLAVMVSLVGANVILRYLLKRPIMGTVELEELMLVVLVFFGLAYTAILKGHVRVDMLVHRFSQPVQAAINSITSLLTMGLCSLIAWQSVVLALANWERGEKTALLQVSLYPFLLAMAFGSALFSLVLLAEFLHSLAQVARSRLWIILLFLGGLLVLLLSVAMAQLLQPSSQVMALIGLGTLLLFLALGMYIAFTMTLVGFLGITYMSGIDAALYHMGTVVYATTSEYHYAVIPFFLFMGYLCAGSGISRDLYSTAHKWLGQLPGGLGMATIAGCAGFAAVSGSSMATAAVMGATAIPEMKKYKYSPQLATGCAAAGGTLGILIPPSITFIFYAILTDQSISKLFIAGIFPGLLLAALFMLIIYIQARINPQLAPPGPKTSLKEKMISLKGTGGMMFLFALVIGGIYAGIFTPTEAGAIGAIGALIIALVNRQLTWQNFTAALLETGRTTAMLFIMFIGAMIMSYFLAGSQAPSLISNFIAELPLPRYVLLMFILIIYAFLGSVMNILPAVIVTLPIFFPTVMALGFDPIWFGVIMVIMVEMGLVTPPVGMNVFVIKGVAGDVPIGTIYRGVIPFIIIMVVTVIILVVFPQIALFLPGQMK